MFADGHLSMFCHSEGKYSNDGLTFQISRPRLIFNNAAQAIFMKTTRQGRA